MENAPEPPREKPPLGGGFVVAFILPIVVIALCALLVDWNKGGEVALPLMGLTSLVCAIYCAGRVGQRSGVGLGILTFLGLLAVYGAVFFVGCLAALSNMKF